MLARERWELAEIEEQRRQQEKERAKVEFRYIPHAFHSMLLIATDDAFAWCISLTQLCCD